MQRQVAPIDVRSFLHSRLITSTPTPGFAMPTLRLGRYDAGCPVTSTRGALPAARSVRAPAAVPEARPERARPGQPAPVWYGRDLAGQPEATPGHRGTADRVGEVTHHTTDVSSVRGPRPTRSAARTQVGVTAPRMASVRLPYASLGRGVRSPRRFSPAAPGPRAIATLPSHRPPRTKPFPKRRAQGLGVIRAVFGSELEPV